jgi:hypothetical protein
MRSEDEMTDKKPYTLESLHKAQAHVNGFLNNLSGYGEIPGSFKMALIDAIFKADCNNLDKLYQVYPEYVDAVRLYQTGELHKVVMVQRADGTQEKDPGFK